jgi:UDP-N-acetyl-D-mannosaminuronate dehydrogenase
LRILRGARLKILFIGLGEVGQSLLELAQENGNFDVYGLDTAKSKMPKKIVPETVDVLHVCIPCVDHSFVDTIAAYSKQFNPTLIIIHSTVTVGTTNKVRSKCPHVLVAHSPIRGVHKSKDYMKGELKRYAKYVGGSTPQAGEAANEHLQRLGFRTKLVKSSLETELGKLFETTYRAWMIACFQEMHRMVVHFKADYGNVVDFLQDTDNERHDRPVMYPGVIGGHCLIPNIELLLEGYDSEFLRLVLASNEKRKSEV